MTDARRHRDGTTRRRFLQLIGANAALTGVSACSEPPAERMLPYRTVPTAVTPGGEAVPYATSFVLDGYATGVLVATRDGRPVKVDGNPEHPASLGATGVFEQASVHDLYDPRRARTVLHRGAPGSFEQLARRLIETRDPTGKGLRLLLEPQSSLLVGDLLRSIRARHPEARVTFHSPAATRAAALATERVFGRRLAPLYRLSEASVIVALDADFLASGPMHLRYAREVADRRTPEAAGGMNRVYVAEAGLSPTGSFADHRLPIRSSEILHVLGAMFAALTGQPLPSLSPAAERWVRSAVADLKKGPGPSAVIVGDRQPADAHALAYAVNGVLGNIGRTLLFIESPLLEGDQSIEDLTAEMHAGKVERLLVLEANPAYTAPVDLRFSEALARVPLTIATGLYENETSARAQWFVPAAHYLESWGDALAYDGTLSFIQPLIAPLFNGRTVAEMLALLGGEEALASELLRASQRSRAAAGDDFERVFQERLAAGFVPGSAFSPVSVTVKPGPMPELTPPPDGIELNFAVSPTMYDGRFADNTWLLELPAPITKLSWDNALLLSPETARDLGVDFEDVVEVSNGDYRLEVPVMVVPGLADEVAWLHLGWGRAVRRTSSASGGFNAYAVRTAKDPEFVAGAVVQKTGRTYPLARTQSHQTVGEREHVVTSTVAGYRSALPSHAGREHPPELVEPPPRRGPQWAMSIDLSRCLGCGSCVVACQAENNVPTVGKHEVRRSREMYWLRIDTYYVGSPDAPRELVHQPMLCQHCEQAPCEYVCPVFATTHSPDGLNEMTYNRCIGTRFCSNNCPYKVRRFNWFQYTNDGLTRLQHNPEVTVRERGVMEKCTYCVQRIRTSEIRRRVAPQAPERPVTTACQDACPTRAIVFGDMTDSSSEVSRLRESPRAYAALGELGTHPRTRYLVRVTNPRGEAT